MKNEVLLKAGGIYHLLCAITHIFFPKMFNWKGVIATVAKQDREVITANLHIMNICLLSFWVVFAWIPFFYAHDLLTTGLGKTILTFTIIFWAVRIFVLQPVYVGINSKKSWQMILFFLVGFVLFIIPWFRIMI